MKSSFRRALIALAVSFSTAIGAGIRPEAIKANLDKIPATDAAVTNPPQLVDAMKGVHPRRMGFLLPYPPSARVCG